VNRLLAILSLTVIASAQEVNPDKRLEHATLAVRTFLTADNSIPKELPGKAQCVVVVPRLMKGAFLIGEKYGRGFAACRKANGGWSAPAAIAVEGGSFGPQLGGSATDVIVLVMNPTGMKQLLGDKFTLGGEIAVVQGPTGENASLNTDLLMTAAMISYSRAKGLFVGLSLDGATLRPDAGENKKLYGHDVANIEILQGKVAPPKGARGFVAVLNKHARRGK
jgi:lipid-binding SYLF domain-containing protein